MKNLFELEMILIHLQMGVPINNIKIIKIIKIDDFKIMRMDKILKFNFEDHSIKCDDFAHSNYNITLWENYFFGLKGLLICQIDSWSIKSILKILSLRYLFKMVSTVSHFIEIVQCVCRFASRPIID